MQAMSKKRLLLFASLPLTVAVTLGVLAMSPPRPGVTKTNFDRIQEGMTKAQVQEMLGQDGEFTGGFTVVDRQEAQIAKAEFAWRADDGSVVFIMFVEGCVAAKYWSDSNETILDKIRRWLHLR
jgi:hypothetical protein